MDEMRKPAFWAVIPATVLFSSELRPNAKLLYGVITLLQEGSGYCYASNRYLASLFDLQPETITGLLQNLSAAGLICTDVLRNPDTNEVLQRRIWTVTQPPQIADPSPKNIGDPSRKKIGDPPRKKSKENNININNTSIDIPPIVPRERGTVRRSFPAWKPERFERFWKFYPRGEKRIAAVKAWDKLQPSDDLIDQMAQALLRQKASAEWKRGIGIPYASTWLNGQRWTDEPRTPEPESESGSSGWAADREVLD